MLRPATWRAGCVTVALGFAPLLTGASKPAAGPEVVIRGTVKDASGAVLPRHPVRLIKTKTILNLLRLSSESQQIEEVRAETDAEGRFQLRLIPDPRYDYFYLRFYDPRTFDPVRYRIPSDVDITRAFKQGPEVVVDEVIPPHPDWSRVQELVARFGADSNRGKILLALGLPERQEALPGLPGRENWWYYRKGVCYQLQEDDVLRVRRYGPVLPPGG